MILIVAPKAEDLLRHCDEYGYRPNDTRLIRKLEDILGYESLDMHYVGEYWKVAELADIAQYAKHHNITQPPEEAKPHAHA